jgi:hypothetical protein
MTLPEHPPVEQLLQIIVELQERVVTLEAENCALREQLRKQGPRPASLSDLPHFVKPNKPKQEPKEKRGRRQRDQGYARPLSAPTRIEDHSLDECPGCGHALSEGWVHAEREVIDIRPVTVEVVHHRFWRRHCGVCQKNHAPRATAAPRASDVPAGVVVGRQRVGIRLMSLTAHLVNFCRTPLSTVRLLRFEPELFTFVEHPHVPPVNNAAERAIRPAVITRKVCGGTRSKRGSDVRAILMSLFGTWMARGADPLDACAQMLRTA